MAMKSVIHTGPSKSEGICELLPGILYKITLLTPGKAGRFLLVPSHIHIQGRLLQTPFCLRVLIPKSCDVNLKVFSDISP